MGAVSSCCGCGKGSGGNYEPLLLENEVSGPHCIDSAPRKLKMMLSAARSWQVLCQTGSAHVLIYMLNDSRRPATVSRECVCTWDTTTSANSLDYADRSETNFFAGDPLRSLTTLSFSDNVDLQRSAALAFAEITEKYVQLLDDILLAQTCI